MVQNTFWMAEIPGLPHESESFKRSHFWGKYNIGSLSKQLHFDKVGVLPGEIAQYLAGLTGLTIRDTFFSANKSNLIPKAVLAYYQGKWAETLVT